MRILLIDDHTLFREALANLLRERFDHAVVIEANALDDALAKVRHYQDLDLILLDLGLPRTGGLPGLPKLRDRVPDVPIIVVSGEEESAIVAQAIAAGAAGYIPKTSSGHTMELAINLVLDGGIYLPDAIISEMANTSESGTVDDTESKDVAAGPCNGVGLRSLAKEAIKLTPRQLEVLRLLVQGKLNKQIAAELDVKESTVKVHVNDIFRALGCSNRTQAAGAARRFGIV